MTKRERRDPREDTWLEHYFGIGSAGRGNAKAAAIAAGYDESKAEAVGKRLESALAKKPLLESLKAAGITRPKVALILQEMCNTTPPNSAERRHITRLLLEVMGETRESSSTSIIAGQGAQILVVQGASAERMKNLKAGVAPKALTDGN